MIKANPNTSIGGKLVSLIPGSVTLFGPAKLTGRPPPGHRDGGDH